MFKDGFKWRDKKMECIREEILTLENELVKSEVRKSSEKIKELLTDDYVEYCSLGNEYHYKRGDIFQEQNDNTISNWEIIDFNIKELSNDCILALYKIIKHNNADEKKKYSLRSSIWKYTNGKWKMFFHQGTLSFESEIKKGQETHSH